MKKIFLLIVFLNGVFIVQSQSLQGYFPFNGNANDESVQNNNGIVNGATLTTDRYGNPNSAYEFDGVNDYIEIPYNYSYSETSITGWAYPYTTPHDGPIVFKYKNLSDNWGIAYRSNIYLVDDIDNSNQELYYTNITENWHFFTIIISNTNENKMYVDNILVGSGTLSSSNLNSFIGNLFIGERGSSATFFHGKIDDIGIHDKVLDSLEIDSIYNQTPVNVAELNNNKMFSLYPNPNKGQFNVSIQNNEVVSIEVYDLMGKQVFIQNNIKSNEIAIDLTSQTKGIYFVRVAIGNQFFNEKVIYQY